MGFKVKVFTHFCHSERSEESRCLHMLKTRFFATLRMTAVRGKMRAKLARQSPLT